MNPIYGLIQGGIILHVVAFVLDILCEEVWRQYRITLIRLVNPSYRRKPIDETKPEHDSEVKRWRRLRFAFAASYAATCFCLPLFLMRLAIGGYDWRIDQLSVIISLYVAWHFVSKTLEFITVYVPEAQGLVTNNWITKKLVIYGQGLSFRFPWETVHGKNHIQLKDLTIDVRKISIPTKKGAKIFLSFQFSWKPRLTDLDVFFQLGASTVATKFRGIFEGFFSSRIRLLPSEVASEGQLILTWLAQSVFDLEREKLNLDDKNIRASYEAMNEHIELKLHERALGKVRRAREREFGVNMKTVEITDFDFTQQVQDARDAADISAKVVPAMFALVGLDYENPKDKRLFKKRYRDPKAMRELMQLVSVFMGDAQLVITALQGLDGGAAGGGQTDQLLKAVLARLTALPQPPT